MASSDERFDKFKAENTSSTNQEPRKRPSINLLDKWEERKRHSDKKMKLMKVAERETVDMRVVNTMMRDVSRLIFVIGQMTKCIRGKTINSAPLRRSMMDLSIFNPKTKEFKKLPSCDEEDLAPYDEILRSICSNNMGSVFLDVMDLEYNFDNYMRLKNGGYIQETQADTQTEEKEKEKPKKDEEKKPTERKTNLLKREQKEKKAEKPEESENSNQENDSD